MTDDEATQPRRAQPDAFDAQSPVHAAADDGRMDASTDSVPASDGGLTRRLPPRDERGLVGRTSAGARTKKRDQPTTFTQHAKIFVKELAIVVIGAIIVAAILRAFVGQMFLIPSESMVNTLSVDDRVVAEKLTGLTRGQVVVFADPGGWLNGVQQEERGPVGKALEFIGVLPQSGTDHLIKRLIGLPGDRVRCCSADGSIEVNGTPLQESEYLYINPSGRQANPSDINFDVIVPADRIFVLGDNRANSRDSRCHLQDEREGTVRGENAFVPTDLVVGRGIVVAWPVSHLRTLAIPSTFSDVPDGMSPPAKPTIDAGPDADC